MGKLEKYVFGEAGVGNLVSGISLVVIAVVIIPYRYGLLGEFKVSGERVFVIGSLAEFAIWMAVTILLGILGGFEIGRYVQTEFTKRRKST